MGGDVCTPTDFNVVVADGNSGQALGTVVFDVYSSANAVWATQLINCSILDQLAIGALIDMVNGVVKEVKADGQAGAFGVQVGSRGGII